MFYGVSEAFTEFGCVVCRSTAFRVYCAASDRCGYEADSEDSRRALQLLQVRLLWCGCDGGLPRFRASSGVQQSGAVANTARHCVNYAHGGG